MSGCRCMHSRSLTMGLPLLAAEEWKSMREPAAARSRKSLWKKLFWSALLLLVAFSIPLFARKPKVEFNDKADFAAYRTYAWSTGTPARNPAWDAAIVNAIEYELNRKGLRKVEAAEADLLVAYHAAFDMDINPAGFSDPTHAASGGSVTAPPEWGPAGSFTARSIRKGSLAVHLFDRHSQQLVWTATAQGTLKEGSQKRLSQMNAVTTAMFENFPPSMR